MTEYEKAMLLFTAAQTEYLHIIAWANRNGDGRRVEETAKRAGKAIAAEAPSVALLLHEATQRI